jgi:hypothetical protein
VTEESRTPPANRFAWRDAAALAALAALAVLMTWPLARPAGPIVVPDMDDAYFSIWRISWIAHQLVRHPAALFDANIFHPATHTFAYSDAMLLVGLAGAPFIWAGAPPAAVHNGLMVTAFVTSAWATYALARRLSADRGAALVAATIVGFAPYRFAHIAHLELQWLGWMPLALLALHALVERPRIAAGLALGACLAGQFLCSIYYGVFLILFAGAAWIFLVLAHGWRDRLLAATAAAALPLALVAIPYLVPYAASREAHGPRRASEIAEYSATPADYLRVPPFNALRGGAAHGQAPEERALYPGAIAIGLALLAFLPPRTRTVWVYAGLTLVAFDASLGANGLTFRALQALVPPLANLRAPARFASLGLVALAGLAALGTVRLKALVGGRPAVAQAAVAIALTLGVVEYWSSPIPTRVVASEPMPADRWLATLPDDSVILELPVPLASRLWGWESTHELQSTHHWRTLVNGYSGFLPTSYARTLALMETFPDGPSITHLRGLSVDYVVVRRRYFSSDDYARLCATLIGSRDFGAPQVFGEGLDEAAIFALRP